MNNDPKKWFAARTRRNQEKSIKTKLEQLAVEHFIPFRRESYCRNGRNSERLVPVIPNIVFVRADYPTSLSLVNEYGVKMWYMRAIDGNGPLIVPQKQLDDFKCICENNVRYTVADNFTKGDRVRVAAGPLSGIEGELIGTRKNNGRMLLRLENIASFELAVPADCLEKIK